MRNFLLLTAFILLAGGMTSHATVLYVGPGETYTTIGQAMGEVNDGDTILVRDGTYDQSIDVRNSITIMAENRHKAIFGDGAGNEGILRIRRSDVIIDGFKFNGIEGVHGIMIMGDDLIAPSNCIIRNNEIIDRAMGIWISEYAVNCIIDSNIISGCDENGIHHNGKGDNTISNNRIQNNSGSGIVITAAFSGLLMISGDTILQNGNDGIRLFNSDVTVQGSVIEENAETGIKINPGLNNININNNNQIIQNGTYGIEIYQGSSVHIDGNLIQGNPEMGILIHENGSGTITNNTISENLSKGIENSGSAVITGNTIRKNSSHGVENLGTASKTWIENNRISNNFESGVSLWEEAELKGNLIDSNGIMGVAIAANIDTVFITGNNQISSNVQHGIYVGPSSSAVVRNNQIRENGKLMSSPGDICGIFADGTAVIEGNIIENNQEMGILVATDPTNTVIRNNNRISGNNHGILILSPVIVDSNKIQNNKRSGILVRSTNTSITRNDVSGNRQGISLEEQASNITVSHCKITNNKSGIVSSGKVKVRRSIIQNNTMVGVDIIEPGIDLGQNNDVEGGYNIIGQNLVCNVSNVTPDTIYAYRNYWDVSDTAKIDESICDDDEDQQYGPVIFSPFLTEIPTGSGQMITHKNAVDKLGLDVVYPNPFIDEITISYHVANPMDITTRVIDLYGRVIVTLSKHKHHIPGHYTVQWHGKTENKSRIPAGVYVILLEGEGFICTRIVQKVD
jgi:parallel beta-helix repeat protein